MPLLRFLLRSLAFLVPLLFLTAGLCTNASAQGPYSSRYQDPPSSQPPLIRVYGPIETAPPDPGPPPLRGSALRTSVYLKGLLGTVLGIGVGASVSSLFILTAEICDRGQGWLEGFTCDAGIGFGATIGAFLNAPIMAGLIAGRGASLHGRGGAEFLAILAGYLPVGLGTLIAWGFEEELGMPTLGAFVGGLVAIPLIPLMATLALESSGAGFEPSEEDKGDTLSLLPALSAPPRGDGLLLGLHGSF